MRFAFIAKNADMLPVDRLCQSLSVKNSIQWIEFSDNGC